MKIRILCPVSAHGGSVDFVDCQGYEYPSVCLCAVAPALEDVPWPADAMDGGSSVRLSDRFSACITADGQVACLERKAP